ncbi:hypothetical protein B0H10DRAFT_1945333 [Mycena sp. CBHHK59/15]|nr:hypothetical protein B0H10DRAFT_1945333 [Mycena sp. CBHHK59/15]
MSTAQSRPASPGAHLRTGGGVNDSHRCAGWDELSTQRSGACKTGFREPLSLHTSLTHPYTPLTLAEARLDALTAARRWAHICEGVGATTCTPAAQASIGMSCDKAMHTVVVWLAESSVEHMHVSKTRGRVVLNASVAETEVLLVPCLRAQGVRCRASCNTYHLPMHVVLHVELVTHGISFSAVLPKHGAQFMETCIQLGLPVMSRPSFQGVL